MRFLFLLAALFYSFQAYSAEHTIEMLNKDDNGNKMVFSQELIKISVGDRVTCVATDRGHNVEMVASPNNMELKSKLGKDVTVSFDVPGIYYYWCTPHKGMGMIGLVVVGDDTSNMDQIIEAKAMGKSKKKLKDLLGQL